MLVPQLSLASELAPANLSSSGHDSVVSFVEHVGAVTEVVVDLEGCEVGLEGPKKKLAHPTCKALCEGLRTRFRFSRMPSTDLIGALLDAGALSVLLPLSSLEADGLEALSAVASTYPRLRTTVVLSADNLGVLTSPDRLDAALEYLRGYVGGVVVDCGGADVDQISRVATKLKQLQGREGSDGYLRLGMALDDKKARSEVGGVDVVFTTQSDQSKREGLLRDLSTSFLQGCKTDRPDGLYTTVVCDELGVALGLVYSSHESVTASLLERRGIYYSRSRKGLWRKGDSSGDVQLLVRIDTDCDGDALRFMVVQRGGEGEPREDTKVGGGCFCHCKTRTCWGDGKQQEIWGGLGELQRTLFSRKASAPPGSYTKRLFDDHDFLRQKLLEEAQELVEAQERDHVAAEMADVMYFAMVRMVAAGVTLAEATHHLDRRTFKVKRRPGNAKPYRTEAAMKELAACKRQKTD